MRTHCAIAFAVGALVLTLGCGPAETPAPAAAPPDAHAAPAEAVAAIHDTAAGALAGEARFSAHGAEVEVVINVENAPPGIHAFHIHEKGDCGDGGKAAGGHWNPTTADHGKWGHAPFHLGDIGNVTVGKDGRGSLRLTTDLWSIGGGTTNDIKGKSVILHALPDDYGQPTGNAGGRIGCGVIE